MSPTQREQVRMQVAASRRRQGLPDHVDDADTLDRLAAELAGVLVNADAPGRDNPRRRQPSAAARNERQPHHARSA